MVFRQDPTPGGGSGSVDFAGVASRAAQGGSGGVTGGMYGPPQGGSSSGFVMPQIQQVPMVYMGKGEKYYPGSFTARNEQAGNVRSYVGKDIVPADEASAMWYDLDDKARREFAEYLVRIGVIDDDQVDDYDTVQGFWDKGIELSSGYTARGKEIDPRKALAVWAGWDGSGESAAARARNAAAPFTGSRTSRSESINLSDPATAKSMANYTLSKALGREALPEELAAYRDALNDYESSNPSVTTTTAQYEEGEQVSSTSKTQGGATAEGAAQTLTDLAREEEDYAEFQAAGPIWNQVLAALQSPVTVG